ncbi:RNA methyltransferase [Anaerococcus sp. AGMB00486]|uniref:RNA methyltransferase n=1 Tax=Anaerococcus faecalis TaxID=2742993 RepID=A0ABX2NB28_9FIRM|nr:RNA methyltransferase [Anaerococcus faecalis]NVF11915.1 RNA methyltransferase [Anaerococcus faecalis]
MIIKSDSNEKYKYIYKLKKKKYRRKYGVFVVESIKIVEQIPPDMELLFIFVNEDMKDFQTDYPKIVFSNSLFNRLSSLENPEGVSACLKIKAPKHISSKKVLLLDHLQDPGNLGTIIRSAEAFGFKDIILLNNCVDIYNEKTIRASMGSIFRLNFLEYSINEVKDLLNDYKLILADMDGKSSDCFKDFNKIILAIGNEANGIGNDLRNLTNDFISIKMQGEIESLNAAIAASILMNNLAKAD